MQGVVTLTFSLSQWNWLVITVFGALLVTTFVLIDGYGFLKNPDNWPRKE